LTSTAEVFHTFEFAFVAEFSRDKKPREARDWIGICSWSVGDRDSKIVRHRLSNSGGGYRLQVRFDEVAIVIFYPPVRDLVFYGVIKLDLSE
jgi:hypothetical protein